jgi:hypothetical protein
MYDVFGVVKGTEEVGDSYTSGNKKSTWMIFFLGRMVEGRAWWVYKN